MQYLYMPAVDFRNVRPPAIAEWRKRAGLDLPATTGLSEEEFTALVSAEKDVLESDALPLLWLVFLDADGFPSLVRLTALPSDAEHVRRLVDIFYSRKKMDAYWSDVIEFMRVLFDSDIKHSVIPNPGIVTPVVNHFSGDDE